MNAGWQLCYNSSMNLEDLGSESVSKIVLKMAFPLIIAQLVNGLYNIVDRIYLGHIAGGGASILTGVGLTYPIVLIISAFSVLIGNGGGPRAATRLGQGRKDQGEEILGVSAATLLALSVLLMTFFYTFKRPLLYLFGASDTTVVYGDSYLSIYLAGTPFVLLTLGLTPFISAQGKTLGSMFSIIIGAALNIILDPIFIYGFSMAEKGAAIATVISQAASAIYVVTFLSAKSVFRLKLSMMRIRKSVLIPIVSLGIAPFVMSLTEAAIIFAFTSRLQALAGDMAVGAMTIMSSVLNFSCMPINGMNQAVTPLISYNFGARKNDRVIAIFRFAAIIEFCYTFTISALCNLMPSIVIGLFTSDQELVAYAVPYMKFFITGFAIFGLQCASQNTFIGLGEAKFSLFFACLRKLILLIPLVFILSATSLGVTGVFLAESIADSASAIACFSTLLLRYKKILARGAK